MAGYTYEYDYAGWTSTGIMGISTKVAGGSIKGRLTIEPVDESTIVVAVRRITFSKQLTLNGYL